MRKIDRIIDALLLIAAAIYVLGAVVCFTIAVTQ